MLLLRNESLVKTVKFEKFRYIGNPCNTVRIFNELEVDELLFLDIAASRDHRLPNLRVLRDIANECFMPLGYGGGITTVEQARSIFEIGFEKVSVNTAALRDPSVVSALAEEFGSQAIIGSIDVRKSILGKPCVYSATVRHKPFKDPVEWARKLEELGVGEILLTSVDREGSWSGFDLELVRRVSESVNVPVIAHGGAGHPQHIEAVVKDSGASAVAMGSMLVFQKKDMGVLVNFPDKEQLERSLN